MRAVVREDPRGREGRQVNPVVTVVVAVVAVAPLATAAGGRHRVASQSRPAKGPVEIRGDQVRPDRKRPALCGARVSEGRIFERAPSLGRIVEGAEAILDRKSRPSPDANRIDHRRFSVIDANSGES